MYGLKRYYKNDTVSVIAAPLLKLIEAVFELIVPIVVAQIIDLALDKADFGLILQRGFLMLALAALGLITSCACQYIATKVGQNFAHKLRSTLNSHILSLSCRELDALDPSSLVNRLTSDCTNVSNAFSMTLRLISRAPLLLVGSAIGAFLIDWQISLVFLAAAPVIAFTIYQIMRLSAGHFKNTNKALDLVAASTKENFAGARVVRAFGMQEHEFDKFALRNRTLRSSSQKGAVASSLTAPASFLLANLAIAAIIYLGVRRLYGGFITPGEIIALISYMSQILVAIMALAHLTSHIVKGAESSIRIKEILAIETTISDSAKTDPNINHFAPSLAAPADETALCSAIPVLEFCDVSFSYSDSGVKSLSEISFKVFYGETVGIIGGTGSGKTTLINLICRLYDVTEGSVKLNGLDVRNYNLNNLRGMFGVVPQKPLLLSGTVRSNLSFLGETSLDGRLTSALSVAQCRNFANLDTEVKPAGANFSGGQKQRLTIARAVAKDAPVLLFDDASSSLDYATDKRLNAEIAKLNKTIIKSAQRTTSLTGCTKILVLDGGRLVGVGTHEELLASCELYREIHNSQILPGEVKSV